MVQQPKDSPLVQVNTAGTTNQPKVLAIYKQLFADTKQTPGFWVEFFVLPISPLPLREVFNAVTREQALSHSIVVRTLFAAAVANIASKDQYVGHNSLKILGVTLEWIFQLKLSSAELISLIAGLERIEAMLDDLTDGLLLRLDDPTCVRSVLDFLLLSAKGFNGTSVASYLVSKNFFTGLVRVIASNNDNKICRDAFILIGVLANLDKFNDQADANSERISDLVDQLAIDKMIKAANYAMQNCLDNYKATDSSVNTWLTWFSSQPGPAPVDCTKLPDNEIAVFLPLYEFVLRNELFATILAKSPAFVTMIELVSYIIQNNHQTTRTATYLRMALIIFRRLVEVPAIFDSLVDSRNRALIPISQEKSPQVRHHNTPRLRLEGLLDAIQCYLRFNIRKTLDYPLYELSLTVLFQAFAGLRERRLSIPYSWTQLWQTLTSLLKHFSQDEVAGGSGSVSLILLIIASTLLDTQLIDREDYLGLFNKAVRDTELFKNISQKYSMSKEAHMAAIQGMSAQFEMLTTQQGLELNALDEVVKQGHHSLSLVSPSKNGPAVGLLFSESLPRYNENDERSYLKKALRTVLADCHE